MSEEERHHWTGPCSSSVHFQMIFSTLNANCVTASEFSLERLVNRKKTESRFSRFSRFRRILENWTSLKNLTFYFVCRKRPSLLCSTFACLHMRFFVSQNTTVAPEITSSRISAYNSFIHIANTLFCFHTSFLCPWDCRIFAVCPRLLTFILIHIHLTFCALTCILLIIRKSEVMEGTSRGGGRDANERGKGISYLVSYILLKIRNRSWNI